MPPSGAAASPREKNPAACGGGAGVAASPPPRAEASGGPSWKPRGGRPPLFPGPRSRPGKKRPELSQYAAIPPWRLLGHDGSGGLAYLSLLEQRGDTRVGLLDAAHTLAR